jgi:hypothetical protein
MAELNDSAGSPFANIYFALADSSSQNDLIQASDTIPQQIIIEVAPSPVGNGWIGEYKDGFKKGESW